MDPNVFNNAGNQIAIQTGSFNNNGSINYHIGNSHPRHRENRILQQLFKSIEKNRKDRNPDRVPGTCEWFTAHQTFQDWQASPSSKLLWVSADPGSGKSVLAKYLIDSILPSTESRTTCYFFFKDDFEGQGSVITALCCILFQLFTEKPSLLSEAIINRFEITGEGFVTSFSELWKALLVAAKSDDAGEIVCVLDALDECKGSGRFQLIQELCKIYGAAIDTNDKLAQQKSTAGTPDFNLKFLLTSRPTREIRHAFQPLDAQGSSYIHLSGESEAEMEKIAQEIDLFICDRVRHIGDKLGFTANQRSLLLRRLKRTPNRTYMWVYLTLDIIESDSGVSIDKRKLIKITSNLPKTVDEAYERILSASHDPEEATKLLHIVVAAARPLTLQEMCFALLLKKNHQSYTSVDPVSEESFRNYIRDLCGLFVTVVDSRVYLIHQTAKEFLVSDDSMNQTKGDLYWKHSLHPRDSHKILAQICIRNLLLTELETRPLTEGMAVSEFVKNYIFIDYSAQYWTTHLRELEVHTTLESTVVEQVLRLCDTASKRCLTWLRIYWASKNTDFPEGFTTLMVVSYFGLTRAVKILLNSKDKIHINAEDKTYKRSALSWAAGNGFDVVVTQLLKGPRWKGIRVPYRGAKVNSADKHGRTPLVYAVWNRHMPVIQKLLNADARVDSEDDVGGTPLSYALCSGWNDVVEKFFKGGDEFGSRDLISAKLLFSAVEKGDEDVVKLLLEIGGVDPNTKDKHGTDPLYYALMRGDERVACLLLDNGANAEEISHKGRMSDEIYDHDRTPLTLALKKRNERLVKLLLDKGADIDKLSDSGNTPLCWAVNDGYEEMVRLLLDKSADINKESHGLTPICWAAKNGYEKIAQLLLDKGADVDTESCGLTPLFWAITDGNEEMVRLLLDKGADVNKESHGLTPICWAVKNGYEKMAQLLLDKGADIDKLSDNGNTPLFQAVKDGHEKIVRLLLNKGVDIDTEIHGLTLLCWAVKDNHEKVARLLLDKGADVDKESRGLTPLWWALKFGQGNIFRSSAGEGADMKKDGFGVLESVLNTRPDGEVSSHTSFCNLVVRVRNGRKEVVRLLLDRGADIEKGGREGYTPLFWAVKWCNGPLVQLLLYKGAEVNGEILAWATMHGNEYIVRLLLDNGAIINEQDLEGQTALFHAVGRGHLAVARLLLARGADVQLQDRSSNTVLSLARSVRERPGNRAMIELLSGGNTSLRIPRVADA